MGAFCVHHYFHIMKNWRRGKKSQDKQCNSQTLSSTSVMCVKLATADTGARSGQERTNVARRNIILCESVSAPTLLCSLFFDQVSASLYQRLLLSVVIHAFPSNSSTNNLVNQQTTLSRLFAPLAPLGGIRDKQTQREPKNLRGGN